MFANTEPFTILHECVTLQPWEVKLKTHTGCDTGISPAEVWVSLEGKRHKLWIMERERGRRGRKESRKKEKW